MGTLRTERRTEKVRPSSKMEIGLMDGGYMMKFMEKVFTFLLMGMSTMDKSKWEKDTEKAYIYTKMEINMWDNGKTT